MSSKDIDTVHYHILICDGKSCMRNGSDFLFRSVKEKLSDKKLKKSVLVSKVQCTGNCKKSPVMAVYPSGTWYGKLNPKVLKKIIKKHIKKGKPFKRNIFGTIDSKTNDK